MFLKWIFLSITSADTCLCPIWPQVSPGVVPKVDMSDQIMSMELGGETPFEHLEAMAREIFLPLLSE